MSIFSLLKKVEKKNYDTYNSDGLNGRPVSIGFFNELIDKLNALSNIFDVMYPATHWEYKGSINLSRLLTHYDNWTANSSSQVLLESNPIIGGSAEIRMIGDNVHTPLFAAFTKSASSADFDPTTAAINKVVFYYDGTEAFYSITVL